MSNSQDRTLGIDVGTSSLKAVLLDASGTALDDSTVAYDVDSPRPGWTQQDPDTWWAALRASLATLWSRGHDPARIAAIGVTGQMHTLVVLDAQGEVVCPALLWSDQRTQTQCDDITQQLGREGLLDRTGNLALPGFTAPKILWVREHWPEAYARAAHMLMPKDFIRYRLTREIATDPSDASGTVLFDVRGRCWAGDVQRELGLDPGMFPVVSEGTTVVGTVDRGAAEILGLRAGTRVVAGGGDNAAAAVGLGAVEPGILTISLGTSGVIFAPLASYPLEVTGHVHVFCHAVPDRWHLMSVTLSAGGSLHWLRALLGSLLPVEGDEAYEWLTSIAAESSPGSGGVAFLPYLTGERTPYADAFARGAFCGLHLGTTLGDMARAVLEGVAFSQRQGLALIRSHGAAATVARGAGGGLNSVLWRQILVDALGIALQLADPRGGAARGAAVLAGLGVRLYADPNVGIDWSSCPRQSPSDAGSRALQPAFDTYATLYPALRPTWSRA